MSLAHSRLSARLLRFFVAVVDCGAVSRAADRLHVAQPSVSDAILTLEADIGAKLFSRTRDGMAPTAAGRALIGPARQIIAGLDGAQSAVTSVARLQSGEMTVAIPSGLIVEPFSILAANFRVDYPKVTVRVAKPTGVVRVIHMVQQRSCDIGLTYLTADIPDKLCVTELEPVELVLAFPPDMTPPGDTVQPGDLEGLPLVASSELTTTRRALEAYYAEYGIGPLVVLEANHEGGFSQLVHAGVGVALLTRESGRLASRMGLAVRPLDPPLQHRVGVVHCGAPLSPAATGFLAEARRLAP